MKWFLILHAAQTMFSTNPCPVNTICSGEQVQNYYYPSEKVEMPSLDTCKLAAKLNEGSSCWAEAQ